MSAAQRQLRPISLMSLPLLVVVVAAAVSGGLAVSSRSLVDALMSSPLRRPITAFARDSMIKTAQKVGIDWPAYKEAIRGANDWSASLSAVIAENPSLETPQYFREKFHAYEEGNLSLESAFEQEIAGKSVGARNFPSEGRSGESVLRGRLSASVLELGGAVLPSERPQLVVDMGCGTGTSTRNLALMFPSADRIVGFDLSPHFIAVGRWLLKNAGAIDWVDNSIRDDARVELRYGNMERTGLVDGSAALVNMCLVMHELPLAATQRCLAEAARVLRPGGVMVLQEMDPSSPGYVKLRAGPLFYVLRSTEPFLDEYFDEVYPALDALLADAGFAVVRTAASTGRHFTKVAIKAGSVDVRPSAADRLASDAHLSTWRVPAAGG